MTPPRLEACYFGEGAHGEMYVRLARVLEHTARKHCRGWDVNIEFLPKLAQKCANPTCDHSAMLEIEGRALCDTHASAMGNPSHSWNTRKLNWWCERAKAAPDGARVLLIDGDMMIRRPIDEVWKQSFDLAYTFRQRTRLPLNGGVLFLRVSPQVRAFLDVWRETNLRFLKNSPEHRNWRLRFAGINQASFGYMLEKYPEREKLTIAKLPCSIWNLCEWERFMVDPAKIIHVKSGLRRACFQRGRARPGTHVAQIIHLWHKEEKEAIAWQSRSAEKPASTGIEATPSTSVAV